MYRPVIWLHTYTRNKRLLNFLIVKERKGESVFPVRTDIKYLRLEKSPTSRCPELFEKNQKNKVFEGISVGVASEPNSPEPNMFFI